ncbi:MAG: ABC transporter permease [Bdellovibrionia bacterium]
MKEQSLQKRLSFLWLSVLLVLTLLELIYQKSIIDRADNVFASPSLEFWFGTDALGRDLFWRIVAASMNSLLIGISGLLFAVVIAFVWGGVAGWFQGWVDRFFMRLSEVLLALPGFLLAAIFIFWAQQFKYFQFNSLLLIVLALGLAQWMTLARVLRAQVIGVKVEKFIEAAHALGAKDFHIFIRHIMPHVSSTWLVFILLQLPSFLMFEGFLSFVGIGVQAPEASWGLLMQEGWRYLATYPHLVLGPSLFLFLTVYSIYQVAPQNKIRELQ